MIKNLLSLYHPKYPKALVSLMHSSRYSSTGYLKKLNQTKNFLIPLEDSLPKNKKSQALTSLLSLGMLAQIAGGIIVIILGINHHISGGIFFGIAIIILYPLAWAYLSALCLILKEWFKYGNSLDKVN